MDKKTIISAALAQIETFLRDQPRTDAVCLAIYENDDCFKLFRPGEPMTAKEHFAIMREIADLAKERFGVAVEFAEISASDYAAWLDFHKLENSAEVRARYALELLNL